jgi:hypothetical protein
MFEIDKKIWGLISCGIGLTLYIRAWATETIASA